MSDANSVAFDLNAMRMDDYELLADLQQDIDNWCRQKILTDEYVTIVRNAMAAKTEVNSIDYANVGYGHKVDTSLDINVNGKTFTVNLNRVESVHEDAIWTELGNGFEVAVVKDKYGNEQLAFCYSTYNDRNGKRGDTVYGVVSKTTGGELYNALVNKYRIEEEKIKNRSSGAIKKTAK